MRSLGFRRVLGGWLVAIVSLFAALAVLTPAAGAAQSAALPGKLGYVAGVSASVQTPFGERLVIKPTATYVVRRPALAKALRALAVRLRGSARPRLTVTFQVRVSSASSHGKSRTLAVRTRKFTGQKLITSARRTGRVVEFRLGRFVLSRAQTARVRRAVRKSGALRISSRASYRVLFTARGRTVTIAGTPWRFSAIQQLKRGPLSSGASLRLLGQRTRQAILAARQVPLTCSARNAILRRLRSVGSVLLSGRRSAAADLLGVWVANPGAMAGGVLSSQQEDLLRARLRPLLRRVGTGHPARLVRTVHWPALPNCTGAARAAADIQIFDADDVKTFVIGFFSALPTVGAVLGPLVAILWPSNNPDENIKHLIDERLTQDRINFTKNELGDVRTETDNGSGLAGVVSNYLRKESIASDTGNPADIAAVRSFYTDTALGFFTDHRGTFEPLPGTVSQKDRFLLLPMAAQYENLYLALLREGVLKGLQWGFSPEWVSDNEDILTAEISQATTYVDTVHRDQMKTDLGCSLSADTCSSDTETMFATTNPDDRAFQLGVGDWEAMWKLYDPVAYPGGDPNFKLTRMIFGERIGNARTNSSFLKPFNVQYPLSGSQVWNKRVKDTVASINAIKADNAPLAGGYTGDPTHYGTNDNSDCNNQPCVQSQTRIWPITPTSLGGHGPIVEAWADDTWGNPQYVDGIRVRFSDNYASALGYLGPACDPADVHVGCGVHQYQYDDESLATVRIAGTWKPYPTLYPNNPYGDSLVFGFRFTDSFYPSGQMRALGGNCLSLPTNTWAAGTQVHVAFACRTPANAEQSWTYDSSTGQLSSSNGAVDSKFAPGNVGRVCLQARAGGTTAGTPVDIYNCSERPDPKLPAIYVTPPPTLAQQWIVGSDGTIVNAASKLCLDSNPTTLTLKACDNSPTQHWTTPWTKRLPGAVRQPGTQRCMGAAGERGTDVQELRLQDCARTRSGDGLRETLNWEQSWYYDTVDSTTADGPDLTYKALTVYGGTKCIVNSGATGQVTIAPCDGSDAQKWDVADDGSLRAQGSQLCLARTSTAAGTPVALTGCVAGDPGQQWTWPAG